LLHISEVAEHRIGDIRDELKEGDQVLVKVLAVEGNRIRLSRKAILKEQRAKMGGGEAGGAPEMGGGDGDVSSAPQHERAPMTGALVIEGGGDFPDEAENEPNFNRDGAPVASSDRPRGDRPPGGDRGGRGGRPGGGGRDRGRGGRGGRPGGGGRDRGRGGPGGGRH
jgi:polyribonucleotide nucleotidyltransferase